MDHCVVEHFRRTRSLLGLGLTHDRNKWQPSANTGSSYQNTTEHHHLNPKNAGAEHPNAPISKKPGSVGVLRQLSWPAHACGARPHPIGHRSVNRAIGCCDSDHSSGPKASRHFDLTWASLQPKPAQWRLPHLMEESNSRREAV